MIRIQTLVFLRLFITKSIIFFIFFIFSSLYLIAHQHGLLASTCKFINFMKSSHMAMVLMFNTVIITILLVSSSKPSEMDHDQLLSLPVSLPPVHEQVDDIVQSDHENGESHGFSVSLPSFGLYEVEGKEEASEDGNDDGFVSDGEFHGFDGYEEDNEGGCSEGEDEDEDNSDVDEEEKRDLERRIQEFIDKAYRKWGEELYSERLLCLPSPEPQFSSSS